MGGDPEVLQNRRTGAVLNAIIGVLLLALVVVMGPTVESTIGIIAMSLGGGILVLAGLLGLWRPSRWGVAIEDRWIVVAYAIGITLLVASLLVWVFPSQ